MLSRSDSAASTFLKKSKSNASVQECVKHTIFPEPLDADQSRIHALIAAHRAMDRSESRTTGDLSRADSGASCRSAPDGTRDGHIHFSRTAANVRRPRSVLQTRTPHLSAALRAHPQTRVASLHIDAAFADSGRISENYGAEPSSYRKIRRTRSILTPRGRLFGDSRYIQHTALSQAPTLRNSPKESAVSDSGMKLRLKRSINALRPTSRLSNARRPETQLANHDVAVEMAREQYFANEQKDLLRRPHLSISNPKAARRQQSFPNSVRNQQDKEAKAEDDSKCQRSESESKIRTFSTTLQNHLKRAFGVSTSPKSAIQQQPEVPLHLIDEIHDAEQLRNNCGHSAVGEHEESRRQSLYVPPKAEITAPEEANRCSPTLHCTDSGESLCSNTRSRVTSWTNSTVTASSLSTVQPGLERNRLSIIKEDGGPHQPSSSAGRHLGGISIFQEPLERETENGDQLPAVDSQRLYSALMKRIGEEEVEMVQTKAAFDEINKGKHHSIHGPRDSNRSTIRAVSNTTVSTQSYADHDQENVVLEDKHRNDRRRTDLALQEEQSSFFPFSAQEQSTTPSPFRKLLTERRSHETTNDGGTEIIAGRSVDQGQMRHCSGRAVCSESIYSRTTDGGLNADYPGPQASMDELTATIEAPRDRTNTPARCSSKQTKNAESKPSHAWTGNSERDEKTGWMRNEMATMRRTNSKIKHHRREHAQIDPDEVEVGTLEIGHVSRRDRTENKFPLLEVKEVPRNNTPAPERSSSLTKSRAGLLKRISSIDLSSMIGKSEESRKASSGSRKYSPGNIARILRERKSQALMSREGRDKENSTGIGRESPPVSTPGRLQLQLRNGNGRLRKRRSEVSVPRDQTTPKSFNATLQSKNDEYDESPTERVKQSLSARLSRPFDMDVPPGNRPFDSVYLGKRAAGTSGERLSVAPNIGGAEAGAYGYGGLGCSPLQPDTALPDLGHSNNESGKAKGLWSSKRMVSDFLKRRRGGRSSSQETPTAFL